MIPLLKGKIDFIDVPEESKKDYPEEEEHYIRIKMDKDYENDYCQIIKGYEIKGDLFSNPESFYHAHRRAVNKIGKGKTYFSEKTEKAVKIIKNKKTIIFSNWLDFGLKPIKEILDRNNILLDIFLEK